MPMLFLCVTLAWRSLDQGSPQSSQKGTVRTPAILGLCGVGVMVLPVIGWIIRWTDGGQLFRILGFLNLASAVVLVISIVVAPIVPLGLIDSCWSMVSGCRCRAAFRSFVLLSFLSSRLLGRPHQGKILQQSHQRRSSTGSLHFRTHGGCRIFWILKHLDSFLFGHISVVVFKIIGE